MRHGSLFSGIGGFDLAAEWMGWENMFQVEWDSFCQKVLAKNFPNVNRYGDIKEFDGTKYRGLIDIISGGFPCQPFSNAGKKKGREDDRYLWPQMLRVINEIKPAYIVGENVAGLVSMDHGKILDSILSDLENEGYTTEQFIIPACAVGAWHRRDRIWIVSYLNANGCCNGELPPKGPSKRRGESFDRIEGLDKINPNNRSKRNEGIEPEAIQELEGFQRGENQRIYADWQRRPDLFTPILCRSYDGLPYGVDRIKSLGNAIVPQVVYQIFKAIEQYHA